MSEPRFSVVVTVQSGDNSPADIKYGMNNDALGVVNAVASALSTMEDEAHDGMPPIQINGIRIERRVDGS